MILVKKILEKSPINSNNSINHEKEQADIAIYDESLLYAHSEIL